MMSAAETYCLDGVKQLLHLPIKSDVDCVPTAKSLLSKQNNATVELITRVRNFKGTIFHIWSMQMYHYSNIWLMQM